MAGPTAADRRRWPAAEEHPSIRRKSGPRQGRISSLQCQPQPLVLRERVVELSGNAQQALRGRGPGDDRHLDAVLVAQGVLQRVSIKGRDRGGAGARIADGNGGHRTARLIRGWAVSLPGAAEAPYPG